MKLSILITNVILIIGYGILIHAIELSEVDCLRWLSIVAFAFFLKEYTVRKE